MLGKPALGLLALIFISWAVQSAVTVASPKPAGIRVTRVWIRATPEGAATAAAYLTIANGATHPDRLLSGSAPGVESILPHSMSMAGGVMRMRVLTNGLGIPPHGAVTLSPGGDHLMLTGLKQGLRVGQTVTLHLKFAQAGGVTVRAPVLTVAPPSTDAMGGMKMP